jgi:hypothetical protein
MKIVTLIFLVLVAVTIASAQRLPRSAETPRTFAARVANAFEQKRLEKLEGSVRNPVKVVIEHSLAEGKDARVTRTFRGLRAAQAWLIKSMIAGAGFHGGTFDGCRRGRCGFSRPGGILHNNLYLVDFTYGRARGKYFIKTLSVLDGD